MTRRAASAVRVGAGAAALVAATLAGAAPATGSAHERLLPRLGSTLIVQPASIGLIAETGLAWAQFAVRDGCGRQLHLGSAGVDGAAAAVPLPAQGAGPGTWHVTWTAGGADGEILYGSWSFKVEQGAACPGSAEAEADAVAAAAGISTGHHGGTSAFDGGDADVTSGSRRPVLAFVAAVLGGLAISASGLVLIRRQRRRDGGLPLLDPAAVICLLALILTLAGVGGGGSLLARLSLAVPASVLITGTVLSTIGELRLRLARTLMSGWSAAIATGILVGLWEAGRSRLMVIPGDEAYAALPLQVAAVGLVAVVLAVGGWFGGRRVTTPAEGSHS